jgi:hypothetical protein
LYDHRPLVDTPSGSGEAYKFWSLDLPVMVNLYRIGRTLLSDHTDSHASYLLDKKSFFTAKALNMAIPGGPKFEPLYQDMEAFDEDWNKFNDINKVVIRQQIRTEYKVAFPHLYTSLPRSVHIAPYHEPKNVYIRTDDPDLPAFYFDPLVNPVSSRTVYALQEVDERAALQFEPDRQSSLYAVVVAYYQSREHLCRFPGAARLDGYFHARQDPDPHDQLDPNLPCSFVAEDSRERYYGLVPGL